MDLIIRNANVFDGTGAEPDIFDIAIQSGKICEVGKKIKKNGVHQIDADGLSLMPGIIDTHTHYDAQISWDPTISPSSTLGVTSAVIGNCGFTISPCRKKDRNIVMQNLTQVEGMSIEVLRKGIDWNFESFPEFLDSVENKGMMTNIAAFIGHSSVRTYVMGTEAVERAASEDEIGEMQAIIAEGMAAGAIGFSSSTAPQHNGFRGVPMPSRLADNRELEMLVIAMGKKDQGIFMLTKGDQTDISFLESLSEKSKRPVIIAALLHNATKPQSTFDDLSEIGQARTRGNELWGQVSCCPLTNDFTFKSAYPMEGLSAWEPAMKVEGEVLKNVYMDEIFRRKVKEELSRPSGVRLFNSEWDKLELVKVNHLKNKPFEGKTVSQLAASSGKPPLDWVLDFAVSEDLESLFTAVLLNSDETEVAKLISNENAMVSLSDAGAHLTFFCDAGFGLHLLGHWSRDLEAISLKQAVYELTGKPASIYRIPNRGQIKVGYYADLLLFDPAVIARGPKRKVFDLPGAAPRLTTDPIGIYGTWVNGSQIADKNGLLDSKLRPGKLLRKFDQ